MKNKLKLKNLFKIFIGIFLLAGFQMNAVAQNEHSIEIHFSGLNPKYGSEILIGLYDKKHEFLSDNVYRSFEIQTNGKKDFIYTIHLPKGKYAMAMFQDLNGDKELNKNFIGYPTEPFTFSNNAAATFGPPKWKDAAFQISDDKIMKIAF